MLDLAQHPELFQPLREELVCVRGTEGLKKTALYNLKLMDSVIEETQRMKPVLLSLKHLCPEGQKVITNTHMWDGNWYENLEDYDGYRPLNMRNTDEEKHAHLVSTSAKHPGFDHGQHACPGRFFASNEIKIALAHLFLKYDWKLAETSNLQSIPFGMNLLPDPTAKFLIRRRREELNVFSLHC